MATEDASRAAYEEQVRKATARFPERSYVTSSGIEAKRLYTQEDVKGLDRGRDLGYPGLPPFTRGVQATGYRGRLWTRRPITGFQTPADTNARFRQLLAQGQTGLHFVFDYPTLAGVGSEHPMAEGEIGKDGVPMNSLADMEVLLDGVDLTQISTSWSYWGPTVLSFIVALADKRGVPRSKLMGTMQNDVLMYYHSCPWWDLPLEANMKFFADMVEFTTKEIPLWNPVGISGYNIREGGCSAAQEIAFTMGDAIAYAEACLARGLDPDSFLPRFSFHLAAGNDFFEEICKMRAFRRVWYKVAKERLGAKDPRSMAFRFHCQTAGSMYTAQQPLNNLVRGTIQAMAAVLGGCQSLHVSCYDEALNVPTEEAARLSVNTQNIIAYESGVTATVDPLGGSYFVESLTNQLEEKAWEILAEVDHQGGMVKAALKGWVQREKADFEQKWLQAVERKEQLIVGVNAFQLAEEPEVKVLEFDPAAEEAVRESVHRLRETRDQGRAAAAKEALRRACAAGENVMPYTIEAAKAYVTLAEMYEVFRSVYGELTQEEMLSSIGADRL